MLSLAIFSALYSEMLTMAQINLWAVILAMQTVWLNSPQVNLLGPEAVSVWQQTQMLGIVVIGQLGLL